MADKLNNPSGLLHHRSGNGENDLVADEKVLAQQHVEAQDRDELREMRDLVEGFPDKEKRKLLWKMDLHIIPCLISLYCEST